MERTWNAHTAAEFVTADVDATMATMTDAPVVLHVPTSIGARGRDAVRRFYAEYFIGHQAADMTLTGLSRTGSSTRSSSPSPTTSSPVGASCTSIRRPTRD